MKGNKTSEIIYSRKLEIFTIRALILFEGLWYMGVALSSHAVMTVVDVQSVAA